jgi:hypothetical protein
MFSFIGATSADSLATYRALPKDLKRRFESRMSSNRLGAARHRIDGGKTGGTLETTNSHFKTLR